MKDRSVVIIFGSSVIIVALILFIVGIFIKPNIISMGAPLFVTNLSKGTMPSDKNGYSIYAETAGDSYIVRFTNVICAGAMDPYTRINSVFRISFAVESGDVKSQNNIIENEKQIVKSVREIIGNRAISDMTGEDKLDFFKTEVKNNINERLPNSKVTEVYIEGLVGR